jgi:hypothetical protein
MSCDGRIDLVAAGIAAQGKTTIHLQIFTGHETFVAGEPISRAGAMDFASRRDGHPAAPGRGMIVPAMLDFRSAPPSFNLEKRRSYCH